MIPCVCPSTMSSWDRNTNNNKRFRPSNPREGHHHGPPPNYAIPRRSRDTPRHSEAMRRTDDDLLPNDSYARRNQLPLAQEQETKCREDDDERTAMEDVSAQLSFTKPRWKTYAEQLERYSLNGKEKEEFWRLWDTEFEFKEQCQIMLNSALEATFPTFLKFPSDFASLKETSAEATIQHFQKLMKKSSNYDVPSSEDDSCASSDSLGKVFQASQQQPAQLATSVTDFIAALKNCAPLYPGFHSVNLMPEQERFCYCPCGRLLKLWRTACLGHNGASDSDHWKEYECDSTKFTPNGLMDHLEAKHNQSFHKYVLFFLKHLYSKYWGNNLGHRALYKPGDKLYKEALAAETKQFQKDIALLRSELEKEQRRAEEYLKFKEQVAQLEKMNVDLSRQMLLEKEFHELLGMGSVKRQHVVFSENKIKQHCQDGKNFFAHWKKHFELLESVSGNKALEKHIKIQVAAHFDLHKFFETCRNRQIKGEKDFSYLFYPLDTFAQQLMWMKNWEVEFKASKSFRPKGLETAADKGGPTVQFLSEVWRQMVHIKIETEETDVHLFEVSDFSPHFLKCRPNDYLEEKLHSDDDALNEAAQKYEAIGRILFYTISQYFNRNQSCDEKEEDAVLTIGSHVLPQIHRNYLLRGITPLDDSYPLAKLADDVWPWLVRSYSDLHAERKKPSREHLLFKLKEFITVMNDINDADETKEVSPELQFRQAAYTFYIENMSRALDAIKRGLYLNGNGISVDLSHLFCRIPIEVIDTLLFAKQTIRAEDVITALDYLKTSGEELYVTDEQKNILHIFYTEEKCKQVEGFLPEILTEDLSGEFAASFLSWVSGHQYIPKQDFKVFVEFATHHDPDRDDIDDGMLMMPDALPEAHTCTSTMVIPWTAYDHNGVKDNQKSLFKKKLLQSIHESGVFYSMR